MEMMAEFPDNHFDLAVVDPPYGIGFSGHDQIISSKGKGATFKKGSLYEKKDWDNEHPSADYFTELKRVSKDQIIWGGNYFTDNLQPTKSWIFWYKEPNTANLTFSDGELAWTSLSKPTRQISIPWIGFGMLNSGEKKQHPTQKPVKLYDWIFANYAEKGMKILDTHLGSMSSAIACHYAGMHLTGCELDEDYFKAGCERVQRETRQLTFL
tara:strand:+ start:8803 stop:9435 length:633 start_codon:yes stop_codon:yes gene_type:complete